jgi:hypothetical protein
MRTVEYRRWAPLASPLSVEFPAELLLELGWADSCGILYGSRRGREVRVTALSVPPDEEQEKVGVFASRIRGEVFLTEGDLAFLNDQKAGLALVVTGHRAGFFVREAGGSIQTVRSHEEFWVSETGVSVAPPAAPVQPHPAIPGRRKRVRAGRISRATLPLLALPVVGLAAALAVFPQHAPQAPQSIEVHQTDRQLQISWEPAQNAVLTIDDGGARISIPVHADQSTATYAMQGPEVEVSLLSVDRSNRLRRVSTRYRAAQSGR